MDMEIVVKVSKFCNLRCRYCYETPWLDDKSWMSLRDISSLFSTLAEIVERIESDTPQIRFHWQGGEPFAHSLDYWNAIYDLQQETLINKQIQVSNDIQSNLTMVGMSHLELLKSRYRLGFSHDVIGGSRSAKSGRETDQVVAAKIDWLLSQGVELSGGIAVISKRNLEDVNAIASFYLERKLSLRLLHIYAAQDQLQQVKDEAVTFRQYLHFCLRFWQLDTVREALADGVSIEPFVTTLAKVDAFANSHHHNYFSDEFRASREWVLVVDTNGDIYSAGDLYNSQYCYGNIFHQSLRTLFESPGRNSRIERSKQRLNLICNRCFLFRKGCDGSFVSHCTTEEARAFNVLGTCYYGWLAAIIAGEDYQSCN